MPWNRNEPDPLELRRRQLEEQERRLKEERRRLTDTLQGKNDPGVAPLKPADPPVWRMEDDAERERVVDPTPRHLARQRRRDMLLFFLWTGIIIILVIVLWVAYVHTTAPVNGA